MAEVAGQLAGEPPVELLATPATPEGHVDPDRVLALLVLAERDGWEPGRYDLLQALLRLPRTVDPGIGTAAAALRSPAGQRLAAWLDRGGLPDPEVTRIALVRGRCCQQPAYGDGPRPVAGGSHRCSSCHRAGVRVTVAVRATGPDVEDAPLSLFDVEATVTEGVSFLETVAGGADHHG